MLSLHPHSIRGISVASLLLAILLAAGALAGSVWWWAGQPLALAVISPEQEVVDLKIPNGSSANAVARSIANSTAGGNTQAWLFMAWMRLSGQAANLKAGSYEIASGDSPRSIVEKIALGRQAMRSITIIEGWNWRQLRTALAKASHLQNDSANLSDAQVMIQVGMAGVHPEGRFFPDTYRYTKGASDMSVLRLAAATMARQLSKAWEARLPNLPLKTPDELLIMASLIEKETGAAQDRGTISGVFANRLRINMRLQTDPTVIYGLGESFDGDLRKQDLLTDTPYNSYIRAGLPPTPIAMPSAAALLAAAQPASTRALYFVARGDGTSEFSETLEAHNRAVDRYIRGR